MIKDLYIAPMDFYQDERGYISTLWECSEDEQHNSFWQEDKISVSGHGTLRGLHFDYLTDKLVTILYGQVYLAVVDCRPDSPTFGKVWQEEIGIEKESTRKQVFIPKGCANGHLVISKDAVFHYRWSRPYDLKIQKTLLWNDKSLGIEWPMKPLLMSERDKQGKTWEELFK